MRLPIAASAILKDATLLLDQKEKKLQCEVEDQDLLSIPAAKQLVFDYMSLTIVGSLGVRSPDPRVA